MTHRKTKKYLLQINSAVVFTRQVRKPDIVYMYAHECDGFALKCGILSDELAAPIGSCERQSSMTPWTSSRTGSCSWRSELGVPMRVTMGVGEVVPL